MGSEDAADLLQDILMTVVQRIGDFHYNPQQKFRGWLRVITTNRVIDFQRRNADKKFETLEPTLSQSLSVLAEDFLAENEYRQVLLLQTLECLRAEFSDKVWQAAFLQLVEGQNARLVSETTGLSVNSVYLAKSRVLARLRQELSGLID